MLMGFGKTSTIIVTDAAWVAVTADGKITDSVVVNEAPAPTVAASPTTAFYVAKPDSTEVPVTVGIGVSYTFSPPGGGKWFPTNVCGYIKLVSGGGSTTFNKDVK